MSEINIDPFALARQGEDPEDAQLRSLFRQWIGQTRFSAKLDDEDALNAACEYQRDLEQRIVDMPAMGAPGIAIKLYLHLYWSDCHDAGDPAALSLTGDIWPHKPAMLRDAARFVPEIAELLREEPRGHER